MVIDIPPNDPRVHVFAVSDEGDPLPEQTYLTGPAPAAVRAELSEVLGGDVVLDHVEVIRVKDLLPLSLRDYLHQAHDIPQETLAADAARLDGLDGQVIVLAPAALRDVDQLTPKARLTHVGAFGAPVPDDTPSPMPKAVRTKQAAPECAPPPPARSKAMIGLVVVAALVLAALLLLGLSG